MISYYAILHELKNIILEKAPGANTVEIEAEVIDDIDRTPWVGIYLVNRASAKNQPLAGGRWVRYNVKVSIWTYAFSLDGIEEASYIRDTVINEIETALLSSPRLHNGIISMLDGGEFVTSKNKGSFLAAGETVVICDATSKA